MEIVRGADADLPSAKDILLEQFGQSVYQFLDASVEVWPTCTILRAFKETFDNANKTPETAKVLVSNLHDMFQEQFKPYIQKMIAKDESYLSERVAFYDTIELATKLASVDASVKDTCLEYAKQIAQSASINDVYSKCPSRMMNQVASMANSFVKDVESGKLDLATLNPLEISQRVMSQFNPADIQEFGEQLTKDGGLEGIMSMMSGVMSQASNMQGGAAAGSLPFDPSMLQGLMSSLPQGLLGGGNGAMPDLSDMLSMFQAGAALPPSSKSKKK